MKENKLWQEIRKLDLDWAERIETRSVGAGFPDMHLRHFDLDWFLESKLARVREGGGITSLAEVRVSQIRWHTLYARSGARQSGFLMMDQFGCRFVLGSAYARSLARGEAMMHRAVIVEPWSPAALFDAVRMAADLAKPL